LKISPQKLREWICNEMGRLGVGDRFIDAYCGRVPRTVLAQHYTDFSPERLKEVYDRFESPENLSTFLYEDINFRWLGFSQL